MKNQFFYKRVVVQPPAKDAPEGTQGTALVLHDSFTIDMILRSFQPEPGKTIVVLDDLHERTEESPNVNPKNGKVIGTKKNLVIYQSEIHLDEEDTIRFKNLTEFTDE